MRVLFLVAATNNFHVPIQHIPGTDTSIPDALSRLQLTRFHMLAPDAAGQPTPIHPCQADLRLTRWLTQLQSLGIAAST